jgi:hypothetical protein
MKAAPVAYITAAFCGLFITALPLNAQAVSSSAGPSRSAASDKRPAELIAAPAFKQVKLGKLPMTRMEVRVRALANAKLLDDPAAIVPNKSWVDRIKVTVTLSYQLSAVKKLPAAAKSDDPGAKFAFYRAAATILTMQQGDSGSVFFYLPGEIVKRDSLSLAPDAYVVSLEVDGKAVAPSKYSISSKLQTPAALKGFMELADRGAQENAGVLLPQYHVWGDPNQSLSPTLVREDSTR